MPEINDYSDYDVFKNPGLFTITNKSSGSVLDLYYGKPEAGTSINGFQSHGGDNQKWQIADVGDQKYVIINRKTGSYVYANGDGKPVVASVGYADQSFAHWRIQKPDAQNQEITQFFSVKFGGAVLELKDGSDRNETPVQAWTQNDKRNGQKWLLKKLN